MELLLPELGVHAVIVSVPPIAGKVTIAEVVVTLLRVIVGAEGRVIIVIEFEADDAPAEFEILNVIEYEVF